MIAVQTFLSALQSWAVTDVGTGMPTAPVGVRPGMTAIPDGLADLVERPIFASLGTIRPDNTVQVNPMWFDFQDGTFRFTHTRKRAKFRNLQHNPSMSLLITDPDEPERYLEARGNLVEVIDDPAGDYFVHLGRRYGDPDTPPPADKADRVVLVMSVEHVAGK